MVLSEGLRLPCTRPGVSDQPLKVQLDPKPFHGIGGSGRVSQELFGSSFKQPAFPYAPRNVGMEPQALLDESSRLILESLLIMQQQQSFLAASLMPSTAATPDVWDAGANGVWPILPGMLVEFHGLQSDAELNGKQGIAQCFDIVSGRWVVNMGDGEDNLAKPCNLKVVPYAPLPSTPDAFDNPMVQIPPVPQQGCESPVTPSSGGHSPLPQGRPLRKSSADSLASNSTSSGDRRTGKHSISAESMSTEEPVAGAGSRTTLMMRNVPNDYSRVMLLDLLNKQGFATSYDFIYLPIDFRTEAGLGYAFVNLISPSEAERFRRVFHGFSDWEVITQKVCEVSWSDALQGLQSHIDRYRNSPVMHESVPDVFKPTLYENGRRVPFPEATKRIRAPRLRRPGPRHHGMSP